MSSHPTIQSSVAGNPQQAAILHSQQSSDTSTRANKAFGGANNKSKRRGIKSRGNKNTKRAKHAKNKKIFGGDNEVLTLSTSYTPTNGTGQGPGAQQIAHHKNHAQARENAKYDNQATQMGGQGVRYQQYGANDSGARGGNESHPEVDTYFTSNGGPGSSSTGFGGTGSSSSGVGSSSSGVGSSSSSGFGGAPGSSSSGFGGPGSSSSGVGSSSTGFGGTGSSSSDGVGSSSSSSGMDATAQSSSTQSGGKRHHTRRNRYIKSSKQRKNKLRTKKRRSAKRGANKKQRASRTRNVASNGSKNRRRSAKNKTRKHHKKSHTRRHVKSRKVGGNPDWNWSCNS